MVIKNNYNSKSVEPLNNYTSIGKGSKNKERELEKEKEGFIRENMQNPILSELRNEEKEDEDERNEDKWSFFR